MAEKIKINLETDAKQSLVEIGKIKSLLSSISKDSKININSGDINKLLKDIRNYEKAISSSTVIGNSSQINMKQLSAYEKSGNNLNKIIKETNTILSSANKNVKVINDMEKSFADLEAPARRSTTAIDKFGVSLVNSLRYNVVNNFLDSFLSKGGEVVTLLGDIDESLNQIQIVSGKASSAMSGIREEALIGAKELSSLPKSLLSAYETYYQQGLSPAVAKTRAEATVMAANVSNQSVATTAEQVTAVLNGFNISGNETVDVLGKMANIGAKTATDFAEIAKAAQKVASASDVAGLGLNDTLAALATISSVTREAPETIGTSLNAILGRIGNLKVDDGYTSAIEKIYEDTKSGLTLFDEQNKLLKDGSTIISELGEKWDLLDINQKRALSSQLAGTRQANRLFALLENWDMYKQYQGLAESSENALEQQNDIYLQSIEAAQNRLQTSWENFWLDLINENQLKDFYNFSENLVSTFGNATNSAGGLLAVVRTLTGVLSKPIGRQIGNYVGTTMQARYLRQETASKENESSFANTQNATNELLSSQGIDNVKLLNEYERMAFLTEDQANNYAKIGKELKEVLIKAEEYKKVLQSPVFDKDTFGYEELIVSGKGKEAKAEKTKLNISSAEDFMKYSSGIKNLFPSTFSEGDYQKIFLGAFEQQQVPDFKKLVETKDLEYEEQSVPFDDEKYYTKINSLKNLLKSFSENGNDLIKQIINETETTIDIVDDEKKQLLNKYRDLDIIGKDNLNIKKAATSKYNKITSTEVTQPLSQEDVAFKNSYEQALKTVNDSDIVRTISVKFSDILEKGIMNTDLNQIKSDDRVAEEVQQMVENIFKKIETTSTENGISIKEQANLEKKAGTSKDTATNLATQLRGFEKKASAQKISERAFAGIQGLGAGLTGLKQIMDNTLSTQEKLSAGTNALGSALSALPGPIGLVGFGISTLGPLFIEIFDIGASESKKLEKRLEAVKKANDQLTLSIKEQGSELSNVDEAYKILVKEYSNGQLNLNDLTEAQQQQYEQVADYVENYASELIKYYDSEGKAVIDLSDRYNKLTDSTKSYLEIQKERSEQEVYSQLKPELSTDASYLITGYGYALRDAEDTKKKIAELKKEAVAGKDVTEELAKLEEALVGYETKISSVSKDWNDLFVTTITKSNLAYYSLDQSLKNSILSVSSYSNFLRTDLDANANVFEERITNIINSLSNLNDKQKELISSFSEGSRNSLFSFISDINLTQNEVQDFLSSVEESDILKGTYVNKLGNKAEKNALEDKDTYERINKVAKVEEKQDKTGIDKVESETVTSKDYEKQKEKLQEQLDYVEKTPLFEGLEPPKLATEALEEVNNILENSATAQERAMQSYADSIREMANSGVESFNQLQNSYQEMYDVVKNSSFEEAFSDFGYSSAEDMQEKMGAMFAALNGDNENFYNEWLSLNTNTVTSIIDELGVYAGDYSTYNEYMDALNERLAQNKVLYEIIANEGVAEASAQLAKYKEQESIKELAMAGNKESLLQYMSLDSSKKQQYDANTTTIKKLEAYDKELQGFDAQAKTIVDTDSKEKAALDKNFSTFAEKLNSALKGMGITDVSLSGATAQKSYTSTIKSTRDALKKQIDSLKKENSELLGDTKIDNKYADLAERLVSGAEMPTFDYKFDSSRLSSVKAKTPKKTTVPNNVAGVGKEKKGTEVADLELELDVLRPYIIALEELNHQLDIIADKKKEVWGAEYLNYIQQEIDLNKKVLNTENAKMEAAKKYAETLKSQLASQGMSFTSYGAIANYNEILQSKENYVNSLSGDTKEDAKKDLQDLKSRMDEYEKYALETVRDIEKEVLKVKTTIAESAKEQIEYVVEIIVEAKDNKNTLIDFLADVQKYKKGEINFSIDVSNNADKLINSLESFQKLSNQSSVDDLIKKVTSSEELKGMTDKQLEIIQNRVEELQNFGKELIEFEEAFAEAFVSAFDEAISMLDDQLSKYDNIVNQYTYLLDLAEKLNKNDLDLNTKTYDKIIDIYTKNLQQSKSLAETIKNSRDTFEVGSEDWMIANEKYLEAQSKVIDQEKALTDALGSKYDTTVSINRKEIEKSLFGGKTQEDAERQLEKINKLRDKYLDKEKKIYSLDKMRYGIMEDIKSYEGNTEAQAELQKYMEKELDYLNNKKDLSQDDLDLAEKQYGVLKARIDMENAYNNKKYTAMLQRSSSGQYEYMYIQDTSQYEAASQNYRDAVDDLYNYSMDRNEALQEENIRLKQEALEEYDRITAQLKAGMITSEEATKLMQETFNELQENLKKNAEEQQLVSQNAVAATQLQILANEAMNSASMERIQSLSKDTQGIIETTLTGAGEAYNDFISNTLAKETIIPEDLFTQGISDEWTKLNELINVDTEKIKEDFNFDNPDSMISNIVNSINSAYEEFNKVVTDAFNNAIIKEKELLTSTKELNDQTKEVNNKLSEEINRVTNLKEKYNELRENVTKAIDDITTSLNKLYNAQQNLKNEADKKASSGGSGGSTSGSSGGGSSSSSGGSSNTYIGKGSAVKVKSGRRWYYDSNGTNPSGPTDKYSSRTLYIVNTSSNAYPYAVGTTKSVSSALGWIKRSDLQGFDTGGYTGDWKSKEGKLALLHEKELVLNKDDTKNVLDAIRLSSESTKNNITDKIKNNSNNIGKEIEQKNNFQVVFPNATNAAEIKEVIEGLPAMATQYLGRRK